MTLNTISAMGGVTKERYLNHPTFGMLYRVAPVAEALQAPALGRT